MPGELYKGYVVGGDPLLVQRARFLIFHGLLEGGNRQYGMER